MNSPYIGITDFSTKNQIIRLLALLRVVKAETQNPIPHKLMVGTMMSWKSLHSISTDFQSVWLCSRKIAEIFIDEPELFNTIHYADYTKDRTKSEDLMLAAKCGGEHTHSLQLDMVWPSVEMISKFRQHSPHIAIVLQVGNQAFDEINNDPAQLVARLKTYCTHIDFVLLDKSMGRGKGMDAEKLLPFVKAIADSSLDVNIAVAGGLGPNSLHLVEPLVAEFPKLSIDAQGQLRPSGSSLDPVDWGMAYDYLVKAVEMFGKFQ